MNRTTQTESYTPPPAMEAPTDTGRRLTVDRVLLIGILVLQVAILVGLFWPLDRRGSSPHPATTVIRSAFHRDGRLPSNAQSDPSCQADSGRANAQRMPSMLTVAPWGRGALREQARTMEDHMNQALEATLSEFNRISSLMDEDGAWATLQPTPAIDLRESPDSFVLVADIPKMDADDISVFLAGRTLTLNLNGPQQRTRTQIFRFPCPVVNDSTAEAQFSNRVLRVTVPKASGPDPEQKSLRLL